MIHLITHISPLEHPVLNVMPASAGTHAGSRGIPEANREPPWVPAVVPKARFQHDAGMTKTKVVEASGDVGVIR